MKTRLVLSTEKNEIDHWLDMPLIPRVGEYLAINEMIDSNSLKMISLSASCWSGKLGRIERIEHHLDKDGAYVELFVWCED
jgi:hypothetical protein